MKKIKLIDFLEFYSFRDINNGKESNKIIRIYYPEGKDSYNEDRYFEFGIYDFSYDTRKRVIQTINSAILNCYVYEIGVNCKGCLEIYVGDEDWVDNINSEFYNYPSAGYEENKKSNIEKVYICSPLRGDMENNIKRAEEYCRMVSLKLNKIPICPHIYFTRFLNDDNELERKVGIDCGLKLLLECDTMYVFDKNGISEGMKEEIKTAKDLDIPIVYESGGVFDFVR